jgi:hypothetical protein
LTKKYQAKVAFERLIIVVSLGEGVPKSACQLSALYQGFLLAKRVIRTRPITAQIISTPNAKNPVDENNKTGSCVFDRVPIK